MLHHDQLASRLRERDASGPSRIAQSQQSVTIEIIDFYWRAMITSLKVLFTILLTIMAFGASWLFWTVITL
jgi:hypothetical protein